MKTKILSLLGLCFKAGKLALGFDAAAEKIKNQQASLIMLSTDLSSKSCKEISFISQKFNTEVLTLPVDMDEIHFRLGKRCGIIALTDKGLADSLKAAVNRFNEED